MQITESKYSIDPGYPSFSFGPDTVIWSERMIGWISIDDSEPNKGREISFWADGMKAIAVRLHKLADVETLTDQTVQFLIARAGGSKCK